MRKNMDIQAFEESTKLSLEGKITFPEVVKRLAAAGVASYRVDLIRFEKTAYGEGQDSSRHFCDFKEAPSIPSEFRVEEVKSAILDIQQQKIDYLPFIHRIMAAGTTHYEVFIGGRKAVYTGRNGDSHTEFFPGNK
jgi:uncharacterized protein YbcV (DUF1398 family)